MKYDRKIKKNLTNLKAYLYAKCLDLRLECHLDYKLGDKYYSNVIIKNDEIIHIVDIGRWGRDGYKYNHVTGQISKDYSDGVLITYVRNEEDVLELLSSIK